MTVHADDWRSPARLRSALRVYAITPETLDAPGDYDLAVRLALAAGTTAVQFRDKRPRDPGLRRDCAAAVRDACRAFGALCVFNDDIELAIDLGADAVHLGPRDADPAAARQARDSLVIGASAGDVAKARALVTAGADYLGVGAIFDASASKPDAHSNRGVAVLRSLRADPALEDTPIVAIGGITPDRAAACIRAGADGVAAIRELLGAADVEAAAYAFVRATSTPAS